MSFIWMSRQHTLHTWWGLNSLSTIFPPTSLFFPPSLPFCLEWNVWVEFHMILLCAYQVQCFDSCNNLSILKMYYRKPFLFYTSFSFYLFWCVWVLEYNPCYRIFPKWRVILFNKFPVVTMKTAFRLQLGHSFTAYFS